MVLCIRVIQVAVAHVQSALIGQQYILEPISYDEYRRKTLAVVADVLFLVREGAAVKVFSTFAL